jgi:hypothetical protein
MPASSIAVIRSAATPGGARYASGSCGFAPRPRPRVSTLRTRCERAACAGARVQLDPYEANWRIYACSSKARQDVGVISTTRPAWMPKSKTSMRGGSTPSAIASLIRQDVKSWPIAAYT